MALLWSGTARAQTNGTIRGTVVDQSGAVVPGTVITVVLSGTDTRRSVTADKDGSFDIPELTVGSYELSADAKGFKKYVEKDVLVTIGHVNLVTVNLVVGGSADTVTVEANAAQVETTSTQLGAVMTDTAIRELPMATRNAYSLLQLQPGVQSQVGADLFLGSDNAGAVSVNGGRGRSNNYQHIRRGIRAQLRVSGKRGYEIRNEQYSWRFLRVPPQPGAQLSRILRSLPAGL
jgi:hypothetical protein